ncbi:hypothetical protein ACWGLE_12710 [Streptomyces sp. NPDC055897]
MGITDVRAGLLPQGKVAAVEEWEAEGCRGRCAPPSRRIRQELPGI